ncbi:MAG: response regulator [Betaproteobacteria bacterium]|nr:response regulator [Betaproteobacteria bacterium]
MAQILVVDDEIGIRELLSEILEDEGHDVRLAESAAVARQHRQQQRPDLVLLDIWMPDTDGITLLKEWAANGQLNTPVVMMSGHGSIETAVEATRIGALDFLEKPIALQRLLTTVQRALRTEDTALLRRLSIASLGRSQVLADAKRRLAQLAHSPAALLLRGERGMRPELFARLLAPDSAPFLYGTDALADASGEILAGTAGGIVFLPDLSRLESFELSNLEKLCARADQHKVRLVSFSSVDTRTLIDEHGLNARLAARISELTFELPALRDFSDDIPDLAVLILAQYVENRVCAPRRFSIAALNSLRRQVWPGNLEELEDVVKDLALTSLDDEIHPADVERVREGRSGPPALLTEHALDRPYREAREMFERLYFEQLLLRQQGSVSKVAEKSGLERTHLYRKLKALGLSGRRRED